MPKIMARYPEIESIGHVGSIILGLFGGPGGVKATTEVLLRTQQL